MSSTTGGMYHTDVIYYLYTQTLIVASCILRVYYHDHAVVASCGVPLAYNICIFAKVVRSYLNNWGEHE